MPALKNGHIFAKGATEDLFQSAKMSIFLNHEVVVEKNAEELHIKVQNVAPRVSELLGTESECELG